jgi:hypothetical protein
VLLLVLGWRRLRLLNSLQSGLAWEFRPERVVLLSLPISNPVLQSLLVAMLNWRCRSEPAALLSFVVLKRTLRQALAAMVDLSVLTRSQKLAV